jgi:hypothetical protein
MARAVMIRMPITGLRTAPWSKQEDLGERPAASVCPLASAVQESTEKPVRGAEGCGCSYSNVLTHRTLFRDRSAADYEQ